MNKKLRRFLIFGIVGGILGYGIYYIKACTGMT